MSRANYVCTACSQHFTRKYSAKRHNFNIHSGRSEIVPYIEYMVGRSSGRYLASHPSWYRKQKGSQWNSSYPSENRVIADSSFRPETLLQPYPDALPNSQTTMYQHKLEELRLLLGVVFTYIGDIIAYQHGLHFCQEVYPYRNQNKVSSNT
jgi:hypothetical protein